MTRGEPTDSRWFRQVLGQYPTGVCVVTAAIGDGSYAGFAVGSFASVSLDPPLIVFFPDKTSTSWPQIERVGRFCVNTLSDEQEHLCRQFAAKGEHKFDGVQFAHDKYGSPIIDGAVAWITCELESVQAVGDHLAVYGRVRELDVGSSSLPLLFFQGGYGSFTPRSLVARDARGLLTRQLRDVELIRPEMELLARDLAARCIATAPAEDHLVVVASAGGANATAQATLMGQRFPLLPPASAVFAAWRDDAAIDAWLEAIDSSEGRAEQRRRLAAVRERGLSLGLKSEGFASAVDRLAEDPDAVEHDDLAGLIRDLAYDPITLTPELSAGIRAITAPVFDGDGNVRLAMTIYGFPDPAERGGIEAYVDRVREVSGAATRKLGGKTSS